MEIEILSDGEEENVSIPAKKIRSFSIETKLEIVQFALTSNISKAAREYGVHRQNISKWCKQQEELEQQSSKRRKLSGGGRKPLSSELETRLFEWVNDQRAQKLCVTRHGIQVQARLISVELKLDGFNACNGWIDNFMRRHELSLRRVTTACQKPPTELQETVINFILYISQLRH